MHPHSSPPLKMNPSSLYLLLIFFFFFLPHWPVTPFLSGAPTPKENSGSAHVTGSDSYNEWVWSSPLIEVSGRGGGGVRCYSKIFGSLTTFCNLTSQIFHNLNTDKVFVRHRSTNHMSLTVL